MKILNLYSGIGGNRKDWGSAHNITAVEYDPAIAEVYKSHFPNDNIIVGDAHKYLLKNYQNFDFIWASPPCPSHSRARYWASSGNPEKVLPVYPDMKIYQEIIFLKHFFKGKWIVENVIPYYDPLIPPTKKIGRHLIWANFKITNLLDSGDQDIWQIKPSKNEAYGISIDGVKMTQRKDKILRNCVSPKLGAHILGMMEGRQVKSSQKTLF